MQAHNTKDETGKRYGRLTVLERAGRSKFREATWFCRCDCGKEVVVIGNNLRDGNTKSCGCLRVDLGKTCNFKHGMYNTLAYSSWRSMKERCYNPSIPGYKHYGARGITICPEWLDDFETFLHDMGPRPSLCHTLERIDNNGPYSPDNCTWATMETQARNKSNTLLLTHNGKTQPMIVWAEEIGMNYFTLRNRVRRGWSIEKALSTPVRGKI